MDDRFLCRAKRIDNVEWVEGFYFCMTHTDGRHTHHFIIPLGADLSLGTPVEKIQVEVDQDTICQCTGLNDKNGKLIWENDICRRVLLPTKRIKTNFKITYVPYKCCISAIDLDGSNITFLNDYINNQYEVEIIGNIFDNQELLEK